MSRKPKTSSTKSESKSTRVPKLRFPEFRGTEGWENKPLYMYLRESRTLGSKGNMARKLTVKLWGNGVFEKKESVQGSINTQYFRRSAGQFIYSKLDFQNQAFGIVPEDLDSYESTVDLPCFDISVELNPIFLLEYVKRKDFYKRVGEAADGSRKAKRIQVETFLNCPITIPSKEEQNRIASCLSSLDDLITAQAKKIDLLKTYKKGLMQQLFPREGETQPRLRFPEFRGNGEWEEKCLASEVNLISGVHLSPEQYSTTGEVPYFTGPSDFTNDTESVVKWAKRSASMAASNDTLITVKGSGVGEVWYSTLQAVALGRQLMAVRVKQGASQFIYQFLLTRKTRFEDLGSGNLIPGLSRTDILDMEVRFPRPDEQQRIASCLSSLDALITTETQKFEALKTHKKGLMQGLFPA